MVADAENIAKGKRAWHLSDNDYPDYAANNSVDGIMTTYSYALNPNGKTAWAVDLVDVYNHINITYQSHDEIGGEYSSSGSPIFLFQQYVNKECNINTCLVNK